LHSISRITGYERNRLGVLMLLKLSSIDFVHF
jgi:hypothetical protein